MIRLILAELRRFTSRRLTQVLTILLLVGIAVTGVVVGVRSHGPSADELTRAKAERTASVQRCAERPSGYGVHPRPGESDLDACERQLEPIGNWVSDSAFDLNGLRDILLGTSLLLAAVGLILGASFIGAEWHWGTVATLLTWEPRRVRVLVVKAVACVAAVFVLLLAIEAVFSLVLWFDAATRGITEGTGSAAWLRSVVGMAVRSAAVGAFSAAVGLAVAAIGRNTAAALGTVFVYFAIVERLISGLRPLWQRWLIGDNVAVFLTGVDDRYPPLHRTMASSALVLVGYAAVSIAAAVAWFRARDLT